MTNPVLIDTPLARISKTDGVPTRFYLFTNLHAGHPYTMWVSGEWGGGTCSITPKWIDPDGTDQLFPDFDPSGSGRDGSMFVFQFRAPASGQICLYAQNLNDTTNVIVSITKDLRWRP